MSVKLVLRKTDERDREVRIVPMSTGSVGGIMSEKQYNISEWRYC